MCLAAAGAPQVLCASNAAHDCVEPLAPPAEAPVGERVWFGEGSQATQAAPLEANRVQKKKVRGRQGRAYRLGVHALKHILDGAEPWQAGV